MYKLRYVCMLMLQGSVDVIVLIDTRHSAASSKTMCNCSVIVSGPELPSMGPQKPLVSLVYLEVL